MVLITAAATNLIRQDVHIDTRHNTSSLGVLPYLLLPWQVVENIIVILIEVYTDW